jgi:hypothetical protein
MSSSPYVDPFNFPTAWSHIVVGDMLSPGVIPPNGIQGFKRESEWDKKKGKGSKSATLTLVQVPPAEGSIKFLLWTKQHFIDWGSFRTVLKYTPEKTPAQGVGIFHPSLADLDINAVVTKNITPIYHVGANLYEVTVDFIEFFPPPPVTITATPTTATTTTDPNIPGSPPDEIGDANQAEIAALAKQAGLSVGPPGGGG